MSKKEINLENIEETLEKVNVMDEEHRKKRLRYLFILLFLTSIMLVTSTYAWFTANRIVSVDSLNVHVEAQGGIEISVDGTSWKTILTQEDLNNASNTYGGNINQLPDKLEPVSTVGDVEGGLLKMFYGITASDTSGNYTLTASRSTEEAGIGTFSNGKFLAFDVFFKVDNESEIYLTPESSVTYLGDKLPGSENSIRFAFVDEGTVDIGSSLGIIQSLRNASNDGVYIWEPNSDTHSSTGIANAKSVYGITVGASGNAPLSYSGVMNEIEPSQNIMIKDANAINYPGYFRIVDVDYTTPANFGSNQKVWTFKAGITKMRIYIWIEGQDVDCENSSASGDLEFKFQLSTNPS